VAVDRVVTPPELATASVETFACVSASTNRRDISASVPTATAASVGVASSQLFHAHHVWQGEAQQTDSAEWLWQAAAEDPDVVAPFGESFVRVHWVAVPKALRARRVNRVSDLPGGLHDGAVCDVGRVGVRVDPGPVPVGAPFRSLVWRLSWLRFPYATAVLVKKYIQARNGAPGWCWGCARTASQVAPAIGSRGAATSAIGGHCITQPGRATPSCYSAGCVRQVSRVPPRAGMTESVLRICTGG
jgi:hypothetical protein